jgi:uncharacterized membrane protein
MKTRQEIKAIGKERFRANYWPCVAVPILIEIAVSLVVGLLLVITGRTQQEELSSTMTLAVTFLVAGPLAIGLCYFFVQVILGRDEEILVDTPFRAAFTDNYWRKVGGYAWMYLFQVLWSLLFIIPGIIKSFAYALTPYILADCPQVKAQDALKLSKRIMRGHKADLFVFYLSYMGWGLLSAITFGVVAIFYVQPYIHSSLACFYLEAREEALRNGTITLAQLEGQAPV